MRLGAPSPMTSPPNSPPLDPEETRALKRLSELEPYLTQMAERERALGWVGKNIRLVAGWVAVVLTAWAAFTGALGDWLRLLLGRGTP